MKISINNKYIKRLHTPAKFLAASLVCLSIMSCNDWLDVSPKSQLEEEDLFSRESGFNDQLIGVYTKMCSNSMYGLQMSIGFAEVLSQNYDINSNSTEWRYAKDYDYKNTGVESIINNIWLNTYSCISNLNILIDNIERADKTMFTEGNDSIYKGEAIGLRAYLHLEMMRYFACAPAMNSTAKGVPYVKTYGVQVTPQKSVGETMQLIIDDLLQARELLKADPIYVYSPREVAVYGSRSAQFNYYACVATLARAYMWNGDKQNALKYANEIIDLIEDSEISHPFSWVHYSVFQSSQKNDWQPSFQTEHIFRLTINDWEDNGNEYFHKEKGVNTLSPNYDYTNEIFELSAGLGADYRLAYAFEMDGSDRYLSKFWYVEGRAASNGKMPLLRMTEPFYIAAECLKDSDPQRAIELLNEVRANRNLSTTPLPETLNSEQINEEIYKEYRKEFIGEGQLFFYYKRLNATNIRRATVPGSKAVYVMPIPSNDAEFGGYEN